MTRLSAGSRVPLRPWGWLFDRALGGGWIGAWGSHAVDTLRSIFDAEVTEVQALLRRRRARTSRRPTASCTRARPRTASARRSCSRNGASVAIDSGFAAVANMAPRFTVFGSSAVAELVGEDAHLRSGAPTAPGNRSTSPTTTDADGHLAPMRRFAEVVRDAVTSGEIPARAPTFADGRACDVVLDRLRALPRSRRQSTRCPDVDWSRFGSCRAI